jgi:HAD superfamily hydrolase (TIGR01484 family)
MRYLALATDYDGTIATDGVVDPETLEALRMVTASGRQLVLVTGRELDDLKQVFPGLDLFDWVVAENGALLYQPSTREEHLAAEPVPDEFVAALRRQKVEPLSAGRVIVATWQPHETVVLETIRKLGLELQVIFNKGAVMVLPSGANKATGLNAVLSHLGLSPHNVAGIGDAENDHAFLNLCEFSVAVQNALPLVKERADLVTKRDHGAGVTELIRQLLKDDLRRADKKVKRYQLVVGLDARKRNVEVQPYGSNLLMVGSSGSGKSTLAKGFIERLVDHSYQFCVIDPEGDYEDFEAAVVLGDRSHVPTTNEVLQLLRDPRQNAVVNLLGVALDKRPVYFAGLVGALLEMRSRTGRPHWLVLDETHHLLPKEHRAGTLTLPQELVNTVFITIEPDLMLPEALALADTVFAVGQAAGAAVRAFAKAIGESAPAVPEKELAPGQALVWQRGKRVRRFTVAASRFEHRRHRRKYAEGDVGPDLSFYFNGPEGKLNLKAQNLIVFAQLTDGVDDATWSYHLERGDYSRWFRNVIKDDSLADEAARIERQRRLDPKESRALIQEAIANRYTLQATPVVAAS